MSLLTYENIKNQRKEKQICMISRQDFHFETFVNLEIDCSVNLTKCFFPPIMTLKIPLLFCEIFNTQ